MKVRMSVNFLPQLTDEEMQSVRSKLTRREAALLEHQGMCLLVNTLFPVKKGESGKALVRAQMAVALYYAWVENNKTAWRRFDEVFGPFFITTGQGRGIKKNNELRAKLRAEYARRGRGSVQAIANEHKLDRRLVDYYLFAKKPRT